MLLHWWEKTSSPDIAEAIQITANKVCDEAIWEEDLEDALEILDLARQAQFSGLPGHSNLIRQLSDRAFRKIHFDLPYLSTPALTTLKTYIEAHKNLNLQNETKIVVTAINKLIDNISSELWNLSTSADVVAFRSELEGLAAWGGIRLSSLDKERINEREIDLDERDTKQSEDINRRGLDQSLRRRELLIARSNPYSLHCANRTRENSLSRCIHRRQRNAGEDRKDVMEDAQQGVEAG